MYDVTPFALSDMVASSAALRTMGAQASSMEEVAGEVVAYLHQNLVDKRSGERACALVRFYKSHRYDGLPPDLQEAARLASDDHRAWRSVNCLTMLATAGSEPEWNDRHLSVNHRAIPLHSSAAIDRLPMVRALVSQLGVDPRLIAAPVPELFTTMDAKTYNVFHVADAVGSPLVPAQDDFVLRYGIVSVVGFGGVLPSGELFATVLFTTVPIPRNTAEQFASLALSIKLAILPFVDGPVFADPDTAAPSARSSSTGGSGDERELRSRGAALAQLLEVREHSIQDQAVRLESALAAAEARAEELAVSQAALLASETRNQAIVRSSIDAIVSIDHEARIIEFNPAAEQIFGRRRPEVIGASVAELLIPPGLRERHRRGFAEYLRSGHGPILGRHVELVAQRSDDTEFPIELTVTAVEVEGAPPVFTAHVRDISLRKQIELARQADQRHHAHIARTLQDSLLPPALPQVPGAQTAARYVPAGGGNEIGGDFYDVFETARNDWAIVLGDVCGKGAEAAAVTALARYTIRAAAMRARRPSTVLSVLNEAVLSQYPERFLTAAYVRLRLQDGRLRGSASLGGHPPPLLVAPDGQITALGNPGLLVGSFPETDFSDVSFALPSGHALVLYTDGVTEARRDHEFFGDERLHAVLAEQAGVSADAMVTAVADAVRDFEGGLASDDVAILVIRAD